jgi:hypothetical protein
MDESHFRYALSQQMMSMQKASHLIERLKDKYMAETGTAVVAYELVKVAKEVMGYGYHKTYGGDPYWLNLKYPGHCDKCHKPLARGERAYYYPRTRTMFGESCGHGQEAEQDFHSQVEMEEGHLI